MPFKITQIGEGVSKMKCRDIKNLLSSYLDGELEERKKKELERHLKDCPVCQKELDLLKATVQSVKGLEDVTPPANLLVKINEKLDKMPFSERITVIWEGLLDAMKVPALAKSLVFAASILLILYFVAGPGQIYRTSKISSQITSPAKISLEVTKLELSIPQPAVNIPRPGSYCIAPAKMAEARKKLGPFGSGGFNNPAAMAQARKSLDVLAPGFAVSPKNSSY